ncbi:MAG: immune inhibitor A [Chloroflexi bacterium]|nr:immune inhibitor A [Chloroflexota bacterium]
MTAPPDRDLGQLAERLLLKGQRLTSRDQPTSITDEIGKTNTFWVVDLIDERAYQVEARLQLVTPRVHWYVEEGASLPVESLKRGAQAFEETVLPRVTSAFGPRRGLSVEDGRRLTILHTRLRGAAGYYSSSDEYPREIQKFSNQRIMFYISTDGLTPGTNSYLAVLAHELQHAIHWSWDPTEETWVNEGLSEVATFVAGFEPGSTRAFLGNPTISLTNWPEDNEKVGPNYGAAYVFFQYLAHRIGGYDKLRGLVEEAADGIPGIDAFLARQGQGLTFKDVFRDWLVANYLDLPGRGPYSQPDVSIRIAPTKTISRPGIDRGRMAQFGAEYIRLSLGDGTFALSFQGDRDVRILPVDPHGGQYCWWSNRGDSIDSTLTREVDLSVATRATLEFWAWFSLEKSWDYAYVEVSTDGGRTWEILKGNHTSPENPIGNSFGHGFTGKSGGWVEESMDLSPYIGGKILLRFENVTDDAINTDGVCIDDIAIPEIGFVDDAEEERGWTSLGFVRTNNLLRQEYLVQLVETPREGDPRVRPVTLDENNRGDTVVSGAGLRDLALVVSATTPGTSQAAAYTVEVRPSP